MRFTSKSFLDNSVTDEEISKLVTSFSNVADSKVFSTDEERDIRKSWLSFGNTLVNCSKGRIIPIEFKSFVKSFEKVDYDITKLPKELKLGLDKTYSDFTKANTSSKHKNVMPEAYCRIYEFFSDSAVVKFFKRVKSDNLVKKNTIGLESYEIDSLESLLIENGINVQSSEANISLAKTMGLVPSIKDAILGATTSIANVNNLINILILLLIACSILVCVLIIIHVKYTSTLNQIIIQQSESGKIIDRVAAVNSSIDIMDKETSPLVKNLVIRPAIHVSDISKNITTKSYDFFDKALKAIKNSKSKEDIDENDDENINKSDENTDKSEEGVIENVVAKGVTSIGTKLGGAAAAVGTFVAGHQAIFIAAAVIASVVLLITCIKPMIYYVYRLKLRISTFFKDQAEMLEVNFENIEDKINDPKTSPSEKERLQNILNKQRIIAKKLASYGDKVYGDSNIAAMDARDDIRSEDKINLDKEIDEIDQYEQKEYEEQSKKQPEIVTAPTPNKTTVIF